MNTNIKFTKGDRVTEETLRQIPDNVINSHFTDIACAMGDDHPVFATVKKSFLFTTSIVELAN
jgi:hypothetical protein